MDIITMSTKETRQISTFEQLAAKRMQQKEAGTLLHLSIRHVRRKLRRYEQSGIQGLIHRNRGRSGNRKLELSKRIKIIYLYKKHYSDFGPTLASEKFFSVHNISINKETLRLLLIAEKLWISRGKRQSKHRKWRERKEHLGELVQLDGSPHAWFEFRNMKCCLLGFIDDATNNVWLEFAQSESTKALMQATKHYCLSHGKPLAFYTDRGGVFKVNLNNPDNEKKTQYQRALKELDIRLIHARSPQAKGRVERLFGTLQDRLVKELRLHNISDMKTANYFLQTTFIDDFNKRFEKQPKKETLFFRKTNEQELENALCIKETRSLRNDFTIQYNNKILQLSAQQKTIIRPKNILDVFEHINTDIELYIRNTKLYFEEISKDQHKQKREVLRKEKKGRKKINCWTPPKDHPWRKSNYLFCK